MLACRIKLEKSVLFLAIMAPRVLAAEQSLRDWRKLADEMVDKEIVAAGVKNERVIQAMRDTPRHEFVPSNQRQRAYFDMALPIGSSQTISPPFIVASMTEAIDPQPTDSVLEIGTGSGYQAAVLSPLVKDVYTIEIVERSQQAGHAHAQATGLQQRPHTVGRRLQRLARSGAVRQDHRHLLARKSAAAARRSAARRRADGRSRRRALSANAVPDAQDGGKLKSEALRPRCSCR